MSEEKQCETEERGIRQSSLGGRPSWEQMEEILSMCVRHLTVVERSPCDRLDDAIRQAAHESLKLAESMIRVNGWHIENDISVDAVPDEFHRDLADLEENARKLIQQLIGSGPFAIHGVRERIALWREAAERLDVIFSKYGDAPVGNAATHLSRLQGILEGALALTRDLSRHTVGKNKPLTPSKDLILRSQYYQWSLEKLLNFTRFLLRPSDKSPITPVIVVLLEEQAQSWLRQLSQTWRYYKADTANQENPFEQQVREQFNSIPRIEQLVELCECWGWGHEEANEEV